MFISNNHALFYSWENENLFMYQNESHYYKHGCLQNFISFFMCLLAVIFLLEFNVSVQKKIVYWTWKDFNMKSRPQWKDRWSIYQVRHILALFWILVALNLGWIFVKRLRVTKLSKNHIWESVGRVRSKKMFAQTTIQ